MMDNLRHNSNTIQSPARAAVVEFHVVSFRGRGGVSVEFLRAR